MKNGKQQTKTIPLTVAVLLFVLALISLLAGCGSSATTATTTEGGIAESTEIKEYTNQDYGFSFRYPATWQLKDDISVGAQAGGGAAFTVGAFDPAGTVASDTLLDGVVVSVYLLTAAVDESVLQEIRADVESVLAGLKQQQPDLTTVEELSEVEVNGLPGFKTTLSFATDEVPLVSSLYFLFKGQTEYQLIVQSAESRWDQLGPDFQVVLDSFTATQ